MWLSSFSLLIKFYLGIISLLLKILLRGLLWDDPLFSRKLLNFSKVFEPSLVELFWFRCWCLIRLFLSFIRSFWSAIKAVSCLDLESISFAPPGLRLAAYIFCKSCMFPLCKSWRGSFFLVLILACFCSSFWPLSYFFIRLLIFLSILSISRFEGVSCSWKKTVGSLIIDFLLLTRKWNLYKLIGFLLLMWRRLVSWNSSWSISGSLWLRLSNSSYLSWSASLFFFCFGFEGTAELGSGDWLALMAMTPSSFW